MATQLDSRQRKYLKGLAHHLKAVVHIGKDGLSDSLLSQIETQLLAHELIKVKLGEGAPMDRDEAAKQLPEKTGAAFVQNIGRVFVLYREHPEEPRIDLPFPRQMGEGGEGDAAEEGGAPADLGFATVRQRGPAHSVAPVRCASRIDGRRRGPVEDRGSAPAPVAPPRSPVRETRSDRSEGNRPRSGKAKARPKARKSKPARRPGRGGSRSR